MLVRRQVIFPWPSLLARLPVVRLTLDPEGLDLLVADGRAGQVAEALDAVLPEDGSLWPEGQTPKQRFAWLIASR